MAEVKLISADSHVTEPADLWEQRLDKKFRDRAPRMVHNPENMRPGSYLLVEGVPPIHMAQGTGAGKKPEELPQFFQESTYKDARPGGWDPAERVKDMDIDGVEAEVIYTTLGFRLFWLTDGEFQRACFRAYNDWLAEYCSYAPNRLAGLAMITLVDIDEAVKGLRRCAGIGLKGAMIWASPPDDMPYHDSRYDPFWNAAQELGMPLSLHSITGFGPESRLIVKDPIDRYVRSTVLCHEVQRSLTTLIFGGVMERFPNLKFVSAENEVGWLSFAAPTPGPSPGRVPVPIPHQADHEAQRLLPPAVLRHLHRRPLGNRQPAQHRRGQHHVVLGLSPHRLLLAQLP